MKPALFNIYQPGLRLSFCFAIIFAAIAVSIASSRASDIIVGGEDSWAPPNFLCFRTGTGHSTSIHMYTYANGNMKSLFTTNIGHATEPPICINDAVIVVSANGNIVKFSRNGSLIFAEKPKGFQGACGLSGKAGDSAIFMTATLYNDHKHAFDYFLCIVDISGKRPIMRDRFDIVQPVRVVRALDDIIVIGRKNTQRFKIPATRSTSEK